MLPLDPHIEIVNQKFPQYIPIEETKAQVFNQAAVLFKEKFQNNYCYLELKEGETIELTLFKSDYKHFDKIEDDFLQNGVSFKIINIKQTEIIIYSLRP